MIEVIGVVLEELLKYQPTNGSWLKLVGDVNFGNSLCFCTGMNASNGEMIMILSSFSIVRGHYSTALKNYFEALVAANEYFLRPVPKTVFEDFIYRRMIKCCMMLQCYTQVNKKFQYQNI